MLAWYCTVCFACVAEKDKTCPSCGARLDVDERTYEERLIAGLHHTLSDRRLIAARALGIMRSVKGVPALSAQARGSDDLYVAAEAVRALGRIGGPDALAVVREIAVRGGAPAKAAAREALDQLPSRTAVGDE